MSSNKYSLENLINLFNDHAINFDAHTKKHLEEFPDRNPDIDYDFNLAKALNSICIEIKKLQENAKI